LTFLLNLNDQIGQSPYLYQHFGSNCG